MKIHHRILHHVNRHQKKYIFGAGVLSGVAVMKIVAVMLVSFGVANMNGTLAGDYMDVEYYEMLANSSRNINIQADVTIPETTGNVSNLSGTNFSGTNK